jgi:hypothetical protein
MNPLVPTAMAAVFLGSVAPAIAQTPQPRGSTTFFCGQSDNHPATLVKVGDRTLQSPLIIWTSTAFGDDYPPQRRCELVSARMANAVAENNGRLQNLRLAIGELNDQTVLCYTNGGSACTADNLLFTLKPENARNPQTVLSRLLNFGRTGSGEVVYESGGANPTPQEEVLAPDVSSISLEEAVDRALAAETNESSETSPDGSIDSSQPSPGSGI